MGDERLSLRDVGLKLNLTHRYRDSRSKGRNELLDLLRTGKLVARFNFSNAAEPTIAVPIEHWRGVTSGKFRSALNSGRGNDGDYLVIPRKFAKEFVEWFSKHRDLTRSTEDLTAAISESGRRAEVYILADDFHQFIEREGLDTVQHSSEETKSSRGRSENPNWSAVLVEVAVELLNHSGGPFPEVGEIAANALARVTPRDKSSLPDAGTVGKKVSAILQKSR